MSNVPFSSLVKHRDEDVRQEMRLQLLIHQPETEQEATDLLRKVADAHRYKYNRDLALQEHLATEPQADSSPPQNPTGPVWDYIQTLPKLQRQLLIAVHVKRLQVTEIAKFLHVSRQTIHKWLAQAEDAVRAHFTF